ncbi:MAG: IS1182 family transposase [bacterium]
MILTPEDPNQVEFSCRSELVWDEPLVQTISSVVNNLDLEELYSRYSESGRSFYDPSMLLKVLFFGYCDGVRSSRSLYKHICYDIRYRYFCGSLRPDFRTLNRFRKDNLDLLSVYFAEIVLLCHQTGLLDTSLLCLDGTKLRASANGRGKNKKYFRDRLSKCFRSRLKDDIKAEESGYESSDTSDEASQVSDPDARYMKTSEGGKRLSYNSQIMVDRNQIIVAADVSNNADDSIQFRGMVEKCRDILPVKINKIAADGGYYSGKNLKYAATEGFDLYLPVARNGLVPDRRYHRDAFEHDKKRDRFLCPEGHYLHHQTIRIRNGITNNIYSGTAVTCGRCPSRAKCTKRRVRQLQISEHWLYERQMTAKLKTEHGRFIYGQRKHLVEPVFGNIKFNFGFVRYALRTIRKVRGEFILFCIAHNLKKMAKYLNGSLGAIFSKSESLWAYLLCLLRILESMSFYYRTPIIVLRKK